MFGSGVFSSVNNSARDMEMSHIRNMITNNSLDGNELSQLNINLANKHQNYLATNQSSA